MLKVEKELKMATHNEDIGQRLLPHRSHSPFCDHHRNVTSGFSKSGDGENDYLPAMNL